MDRLVRLHEACQAVTLQPHIQALECFQGDAALLTLEPFATLLQAAGRLDPARLSCLWSRRLARIAGSRLLHGGFSCRRPRCPSPQGQLAPSQP